MSSTQGKTAVWTDTTAPCFANRQQGQDDSPSASDDVTAAFPSSAAVDPFEALLRRFDAAAAAAVAKEGSGPQPSRPSGTSPGSATPNQSACEWSSFLGSVGTNSDQHMQALLAAAAVAVNQMPDILTQTSSNRQTSPYCGIPTMDCGHLRLPTSASPTVGRGQSEDVTSSSSGSAHQPPHRAASGGKTANARSASAAAHWSSTTTVTTSGGAGGSVDDFVPIDAGSETPSNIRRRSGDGLNCLPSPASVAASGSPSFLNSAGPLLPSMQAGGSYALSADAISLPLQDFNYPFTECSLMGVFHQASMSMPAVPRASAGTPGSAASPENRRCNAQPSSVNSSAMPSNSFQRQQQPQTGCGGGGGGGSNTTSASSQQLLASSGGLGGSGLVPHAWGASEESLGASPADVEWDLAMAVARYSNAGARILGNQIFPGCSCCGDGSANEFHDRAPPPPSAAALQDPSGSLYNQLSSFMSCPSTPGYPSNQSRHHQLQHIISQQPLGNNSFRTGGTAGKSPAQRRNGFPGSLNYCENSESACALAAAALNDGGFVPPSILEKGGPLVASAAPVSAAPISAEGSAHPTSSTPSVLLPVSCAALSVNCLETAGEKQAASRVIPTFSSESYFSFLSSLEPEVFSQLARMVARFRRTTTGAQSARTETGGDAERGGGSVIVSVNLCSCRTPHLSAVSGAHSSLHRHQMDSQRPETQLSVMLVELHPELPVVEFLDRRLPAVVRQHVGNRLDRNFVVQAYGVSLLRSNLYRTTNECWKVADLPACQPADLTQLQRHPLYRHLLTDLAQRPVGPRIANLTLCPIQYKPHRPLPASAAHSRGNNHNNNNNGSHNNTTS